MPSDVRDIALVGLCVIAVYTDVTAGKIKNWLTFPMMAFGIVLSPMVGNPWWEGAVGLVAALAVGVVFWRVIPALKAGDVKMLMAAGSLLGPQGGIRAILLSALLFFPVGVVFLIARGRMKNFFRVAGGFFKNPTKRDSNTTLMIHAPVIAAAIALARLQSWPELW